MEENKEIVNVLSKLGNYNNNEKNMLEHILDGSTGSAFHLFPYKHLKRKHMGAWTRWMYLHLFVSAQRNPRSHTCTTTANTLIQWFCISHNSVPTLSSHPSGTYASPTRSTGAVGGRRRAPAVPAHLSQPPGCCAKPQLSRSN